jgi:hypothetical protein
MVQRTLFLVGIFCLVTFCLVTGACSPSGPARGSPEWLHQAARDTFAAGDLEKTVEHLEKLERSEGSPYVPSARVWRTILTAGLAHGHLEIAEAYSAGSKRAGANKTAFLRQKTEHLKEAGRHAFYMLESSEAFLKDSSEQPVVVEFPFPRGSAAPVPELNRVYDGLDLGVEQRRPVEVKTLDRGVVRAVSTVLTSADDTAGAQKALQSGRVEVPPARFLLAMATMMEKLSPIFDRTGLGEPSVLEVVRKRAIKATEQVLALEPDEETTTAAKELQADLEKALKAMPRRMVATPR